MPGMQCSAVMCCVVLLGVLLVGLVLQVFEQLLYCCSHRVVESRASGACNKP